ncbi:MAG TPA: hypothetical protein PLZ30_12715, partial [Deltaproteobacteria bacterium]|nr:hypothetical protein [Deltaproteobacteria bacterium]
MGRFYTLIEKEFIPEAFVASVSRQKKRFNARALEQSSLPAVIAGVMRGGKIAGSGRLGPIDDREAREAMY